MKTEPPQDHFRRHVIRNIMFGVIAIGVSLGGAGGLAAVTSLSGAVMAQGKMVVDGQSKRVQHPTGGVVDEIFVKEGSKVNAGDILIRLDSAVPQAALASASARYNQLLTRQARLEAELEGASEITVPEELKQRLPPEELEAVFRRERRLFSDRLAERIGRKARLKEQAQQLLAQAAGLEAQLKAKSEEIALLEEQYSTQKALLAKGLATSVRFEALARESSLARGQHGEITATVAASKAKSSEIELQLLQVDETMRSEAAAELRDVQNLQEEARAQEVAALDKLKHVEIKAPTSGVVHQLMVHTVGGVIGPAEVLMDIVPQDALLHIEARVMPQDIDQITIGQPAVVRLTALNRNNTPELNGVVSRFSADLETDPKTGVSFYKVDIVLPQRELDEKISVSLTPGMPAEVFITTSERTILSYLAKPISDHANRALKEE